MECEAKLDLTGIIIILVIFAILPLGLTMFKYFQAFKEFKGEQAMGATWNGKGEKSGGTPEQNDEQDDSSTLNPLRTEDEEDSGEAYT